MLDKGDQSYLFNILCVFMAVKMTIFRQKFVPFLTTVRTSPILVPCETSHVVGIFMNCWVGFLWVDFFRLRMFQRVSSKKDKMRCHMTCMHD